jgi:hypothetical protein
LGKRAHINLSYRDAHPLECHQRCASCAVLTAVAETTWTAARETSGEASTPRTDINIIIATHAKRWIAEGLNREPAGRVRRRNARCQFMRLERISANESRRFPIVMNRERSKPNTNTRRRRVRSGAVMDGFLLTAAGHTNAAIEYRRSNNHNIDTDVIVRLGLARAERTRLSD